MVVVRLAQSAGWHQSLHGRSANWRIYHRTAGGGTAQRRHAAAFSTRTVLDEAPPELIAEVDAGEITVSATSPRFRLSVLDVCIERAERAQERAVRREETVSMQPYNRLSVARRSRCSANCMADSARNQTLRLTFLHGPDLRRGVGSGLYRCLSRRPNPDPAAYRSACACIGSREAHPPALLPASGLHRRGTDAAWIARAFGTAAHARYRNHRLAR